MKIKGGDFLIHKTDPSSIFITEEWNEEQIMLRDMVQDFLKKNFTISLRNQMQQRYNFCKRITG